MTPWSATSIALNLARQPADRRRQYIAGMSALSQRCVLESVERHAQREIRRAKREGRRVEDLMSLRRWALSLLQSMGVSEQRERKVG